MKYDEKLSLRVDVLRHFTAHPIKTDADLRRFAVGIAGHRWLDRAICANHSAPWDLIRAVFFGEKPEILGVGPRGGYKTQTLGLLNAIEGLAKPELEIVHAAATIKQAMRAHEFTKKYLQTDAVRASGLVEKAKFRKWDVELPNKSQIEVLPGTEGGLNSVHAQRLRLDEFELIKQDVIDDARFVPSSFNGYDRNLTFVSARKYRNGNVDRIILDRKFAAVKRIIWCVSEVVEKCPTKRHGEGMEVFEVDDPNDAAAPPVPVKAFTGCRSCPILPDCRGQFAKSEGWIQLDDVIEEYGKVDRAAWNAQKRSRRVENRTGLVFRFTKKNIVQDLEPVAALPLRLAVDFGGGGRGVTAVLFWQEVDGQARVYAEYIAEKRTGPDDDVPIVESILDDLFPGMTTAMSIADSASPVMIDSWNKLTKRFYLDPVRKLSTKRDMVATLSSLIEPAGGEPRYVVHPRCTVHIEQIGSFRLKNQIVGKIRQAAYSDNKNDSVDAATYLSLSVGPSATGSAPRVWVVATASGRVETSEPPIKFHDGKDLTYDNYVGAKLDRLLRKGGR